MNCGKSDFTRTPKIGNLVLRDRLVTAIREWFHGEGFFEVETPVRIPAPAPEPFIDCPSSDGAWLRASPELQMKRLVADGADKIFQIGPCFRSGELGSRHNPEFTMLEWYRRGVDCMKILDDTRRMLVSSVGAATGDTKLKYRGVVADVAAEWRVVTVREAFREWAGWDPVESWDSDRFDVDMATKVEPALPRDVACVLCEYPAQAASLSKLKADDPRVAERWELYVCGMELANAFSELTDGAVQRERFNEAVRKRIANGEADYGLDESFLADLEGGAFGTCGGIAVGIDRLAMLVCGVDSIGEVRPFCPVPGGCWK